MANVTKRTNQAGEVSYKFQVLLGRDMDGKQITKSTTWKPPAGMKPTAAEKEAQKQAVLFEEKVKNGVVTIDGNIKFADYAARWIEVAELRPATASLYNQLLVRINQAIGHIPLDKLRVEHIKLFIKNLREDNVRKDRNYKATDAYFNKVKSLNVHNYELCRMTGVSRATIINIKQGKTIGPTCADKLCAALELKKAVAFEDVTPSELSDSTIHTYYRLIRTILLSAKKSKIVPHSVTEFMDAPRIAKKEAPFLDDKQARAFLSALMLEPDIRIKTALMIMLVTGVRRGELCGLTWASIDFDNMAINITCQTQYIKGQVVETPTKTDSSVRSITVSPFVMTILSEYWAWWNDHRDKCSETWQNEKDRLFVSEDGKPVGSYVIYRWLVKFTERNELPEISPHGLRHTFITLQMAAGVDVRTIQARSGHAQASTLLNVYSHAIQSAQGRAAAAMDNMLLPAASEVIALPEQG